VYGIIVQNKLRNEREGLNDFGNFMILLAKQGRMQMTKFPTDEQIDDLWDEIGSYFNLYDEVRDTVREALNRWGTPEPRDFDDYEND
jgi:hypothetical protein